MGCCGGSAKDKENEPKSLKNRSCTDVICLLIFISFVGLLGLVSGLAIYTGDYQMLLYDQDYLGQRCGVGPNEGKKKAYYPRLVRDMAEQSDKVQSNDFWGIKLYALCVAECPSDFDIDTPDLIKDYGWDPNSPLTQSFGTGTQEYWISPFPTVDLLNRCVPRTESSSVSDGVCAYPNCTNVDVVAAGGVCSTDPTHTGGQWYVCPEGASGPNDEDCSKQRGVCLVREKETVTTTYELATEDEAAALLLANVAGAVGGFFEIVSSISKAWVYVLLGGIVLPIALAFMYMVLLYFFAKIIIWGLLLLLIFCELLATFVCFSRSGIVFKGIDGGDLITGAKAATNVTAPNYVLDALAVVDEDSKWLYATGFILLSIVSVVTIITVILARKKINICAAIVSEATTVFKTMPMMMVFPSLSTCCQVLVTMWFFFALVLIQTTKPESLSIALGYLSNYTSSEIDAYAASPSPSTDAAAWSLDPISSLREWTESSWWTNISILVTFYGFFVLVQFVNGIAWCTMSGATYWWYFFRTNQEEATKWPIAGSLKRVLFYHAGSVAFAAFVIAFCDMLRAAAAYIEKQMGPANNMLVKLAWKVLHCCLWCLKKTVQFVSYYGLVFVSSQGLSFCLGCYRTFFFFLQNPGQVSINLTVTTLLRLTGILSMPLLCGTIFYYILDTVLEQANAIYPAALIFVCAGLMTVSCMTVFDCAITTIFVCCFQDKAEFGGKYMSQELADAFQIKRNGKDPTASSSNATASAGEVKQEL